MVMGRAVRGISPDTPDRGPVHPASNELGALRLKMRPTSFAGRYALIFDADDTLWENNIYFERAFADFVDFLSHSTLTPVQVRDVLNEIELVNAKIHGYGARNFGRNLQQAYRHLAEDEIRTGDLSHLMSLAERIMEQPL